MGPGGPLWSEYVTTTNFHYQPLFFREILYSLIRNKINTSELQFRKSRSTVPKTTYFLPLGPHNDIFQKSGDNVRFLIGELLLWLIVGIASSFGSGGESRAGCVYSVHPGQHRSCIMSKIVHRQKIKFKIYPKNA